MDKYKLNEETKFVSGTAKINIKHGIGKLPITDKHMYKIIDDELFIVANLSRKMSAKIFLK